MIIAAIALLATMACEVNNPHQKPSPDNGSERPKHGKFSFFFGNNRR